MTPATSQKEQESRLPSSPLPAPWSSRRLRSLTTQLRSLRGSYSASQLAAHQATILRRLSKNIEPEFNIDCITDQPRIDLIRGATTRALTAPYYWKEKWRIVIDHNDAVSHARFAICWAYKQILDADRSTDEDDGDATTFADSVLAPTSWITRLINNGVTDPHALAEIFNAPTETIRRQLDRERNNYDVMGSGTVLNDVPTYQTTDLEGYRQ